MPQLERVHELKGVRWRELTAHRLFLHVNGLSGLRRWLWDQRSLQRGHFHLLCLLGDLLRRTITFTIMQAALLGAPAVLHLVERVDEEGDVRAPIAAVSACRDGHDALLMVRRHLVVKETQNAGLAHVAKLFSFSICLLFILNLSHGEIGELLERVGILVLI